MLTNPTVVYTKDEEVIEINSDILDWLKTQTPPTPASNVNLVGRYFTEISLPTVPTSSTFQCTSGFDTSRQSTVTFFIENIGGHDAEVKLQISPDNSKYIDDSSSITIPAGEMKALVPMIFAKYTHVCYKSSGSNSTNLKITMQAHV
ncbi:DUF6385 domain-containing protein [Clostridium aestuarii]|uniref:DUF6385 domain-containing protein n=1 Tax=Clostridium aestuarii TaxID=338193 RepID=A0ABT4CUT4_9CLOT|nr:DUF6385 domain-containing protein [Clostridium aestuarii]MCY6482741.1 DUF6385 domain-containing protein [Clostridium aestuarii]